MHNISKKLKIELDNGKNKYRSLNQILLMKMSIKTLNNFFLMNKAKIKTKLEIISIYNKNSNKKAFSLHHQIQNYGKLESREDLKKLQL